MTQNRMAEVARLFDKKLGEKFDIKFGNSRYTVCITENGLEDLTVRPEVISKGVHWKSILEMDSILVNLLMGKAEIIE